MLFKKTVLYSAVFFALNLPTPLKKRERNDTRYRTARKTKNKVRNTEL